MTEDTPYIFMEEKLKMEEEETSDICIERAHRLGKGKDDKRTRPIIAKFSFHKDKERILSKAYILAGTGPWNLARFSARNRRNTERFN